MRKLHSAVVVVAALGSISFIGAGTASADDWSGFGQRGGGFDITQLNNCRSHDTNLGLADNIGIADGALGNILGGEGNPGAQVYKSGSTVGCSNQAFNQAFDK